MNNTQTTNQSKSLENPIKTGNKVARNKKGQFMKGHEAIGGRPQGSKDFKTLMDEAVESIAKANNLPESEVWQVLIKRGYSEAKDGNYPFFKDLLDRYYGKAHDVFEGDPKKPIIIQISKEEKKRINKALKEI